MTFSNKILYKQYIDITNQTNKNIIQKQGYLIDHLKSNVTLSSRHPNGITTVRDWKIRVLLEKDVGIGTFHFLGFHVVATYFISKIRKLYNLQYILNSMHLY